MTPSLAIITGIMKRYQLAHGQYWLDFGCSYIGNYDASLRGVDYIMR